MDITNTNTEEIHAMQLMVTNQQNIDALIKGENIYGAKNILPLSVGTAKFDNFSVLTHKHMLLTKDGGNNIVKIGLNISNGIPVPTNSNGKQTTFPKGSFAWGSEFTGDRVDPLSNDPSVPYIFPTRKPDGTSTYIARLPDGEGVNFYDLELQLDADYNVITLTHPSMVTPDARDTMFKSQFSERPNDVIVYYGKCNFSKIDTYNAVIKLNDHQYVFIADLMNYVHLDTATKKSRIKEFVLKPHSVNSDMTIKSQMHISLDKKIHLFSFFSDTDTYNIQNPKFKGYVLDPWSFKYTEVEGEFPGAQIFIDPKTDTAFIYDVELTNYSTSKCIYQYNLATHEIIPLQSLEYDIFGNLVSQKFDGSIQDSTDLMEGGRMMAYTSYISSFVFTHDSNGKVKAALFTINDRVYQIKRSIDNWDSTTELITDFVILDNSSLDGISCSVYDEYAPVNDKVLFKYNSRIFLNSEPIVYIGPTVGSTDVEKLRFMSKFTRHYFENPKRKTKILYNGIYLKSSSFTDNSTIDKYNSIRELLYHNGGFTIKDVQVFSGSVINENYFYSYRLVDFGIKNDFIDILYITLVTGETIVVSSILDSTAYNVPFMTTLSNRNGFIPCPLVKLNINDPYKSYDVYNITDNNALLIYDRYKDSFLFQNYDIKYYTDAYTPTGPDYFGSSVNLALSNNIIIQLMQYLTTTFIVSISLQGNSYGTVPISHIKISKNDDLSTPIVDVDYNNPNYSSPQFTTDEYINSTLYVEVTVSTGEKVLGILYIPNNMYNITAETPVQPFYVFDPFIDFNRPTSELNSNYNVHLKLGPNILYTEDVLVKVSVDGVLNESLNKTFDNSISPADDNFVIVIPNLAPGEHTISFEAESITTPARAHATFSKSFTIPERMTLPTNIQVVSTYGESFQTTISFDAPTETDYEIECFLTPAKELYEFADYMYEINGDSMVNEFFQVFKTDSINPVLSHTFENPSTTNRYIVLLVIKDPIGVKMPNKYLFVSPAPAN